MAAIRLTVVTCALSLACVPALSQGLTCGTAVEQPQQYVAGVNQMANQEYFNGIPYKCGWNQQCRYLLLQQLNGWYLQQSNMVNGWYQQIVANCSSNPESAPRRVKRKQPQNSAPELDEDDVASIDVDKEDKTVRIRIPSTPSGFQQ